MGNDNDGTISVFLNTGDGTFRPQVTYDTGTFPEALATADLNGDGVSDLALADWDENLTVLLSQCR